MLILMRKIMKNYKLGVIGHGYVGESQSFAFSPSFDVRVYDKDSLKSTHSKRHLKI
mgnify:CR=1 FL=1